MVQRTAAMKIPPAATGVPRNALLEFLLHHLSMRKANCATGLRGRPVVGE
jgi:hypothetical protein